MVVTQISMKKKHNIKLINNILVIKWGTNVEK